MRYGQFGLYLLYRDELKTKRRNKRARQFDFYLFCKRLSESYSSEHPYCCLLTEQALLQNVKRWQTSLISLRPFRTTLQKFENAYFTLISHRMFSIHTTREGFKNACDNHRFFSDFCLTKTWSGKHMVNVKP